MSEQYNGWTNYATWRVNLEIFDGAEFSPGEISRENLKEFAEEILESQCYNTNSIIFGYAIEFLRDVNWNELVKHFEDNCE